MTAEAKLLIDRARALSPDERIEIAEALMASIAGETSEELDRQWDGEIADRIAALDSGDSHLREADEIFAEARQRLAPR